MDPAVLIGHSRLGTLLVEHPMRERLRSAHMRALYRVGRQGEALASYDELRVLLADELGLDPGTELTALQRAILTQDPALAVPVSQVPPSPRPGRSLPESPTDLIGRETAVADVCGRLESNRLVTLTGPGGVGKTRLAIQAAVRLNDALPDGAWLVELAALDPVADQDAVPLLAETITTVLDVRSGTESAAPMSAVERLTEALRSRRLLVVLDNCEHVVEPVAALAEQLLRTVPGLRLLATSQEPLALAGGVVWNVPPLDVPDRAAKLPELGRAGAVQPFVACASAAARGFTLDPETAAAVGVLCRRLDGIPLSLELAATRVRALGVQGLVDRLDDRFRLLASGHRGAPPRQRTLLAMIDWSWVLLTAPEQTVLRRLAVHADGCTLKAAEYVCADAGVSVLDQLVRLVDRSLVVSTAGPDGPRYRLLESVAAYCLDRLIALQRGDHATAVVHGENALRLAVAQGHRTGQIFAMLGLSCAARRDGRLELAETHLRGLLSLTPREDAEQTPPPHVPMVMAELGFAAEQRGDAAGAVASHLEVLDLTARFTTARDFTIAVDGLAGAMAVAGFHDRAARLLGSADAMCGASGRSAAPAERDDIDRITTLVRAALGAHRFAAAHARGATLPGDDVRALVAVSPLAAGRA